MSRRRPRARDGAEDDQSDTGSAALYVSHDLSVVANFADRSAVMYAGRLVERAPTAVLFRAAAHHYTAAAPGRSLG